MSALRVSLVAFLLVASACASSSTPVPEAAPSGIDTARAGSDPEVISMAELTDPAIGDIDALTAVRRLRPRFLAYRGNPSVVTSGAGLVQISVDGGRLQPIEALATLRTTEIVEMRYLSTASAAQQFGALARVGPVIVVKRR